MEEEEKEEGEGEEEEEMLELRAEKRRRGGGPRARCLRAEQRLRWRSGRMGGQVLLVLVLVLVAICRMGWEVLLLLV